MYPEEIDIVVSLILTFLVLLVFIWFFANPILIPILLVSGMMIGIFACTATFGFLSVYIRTKFFNKH